MDSNFLRLIGGFVVSAAVATGAFSVDSFNSMNADLGLQTQAESIIETESEMPGDTDLSLEVQVGNKQPVTQPTAAPTIAPEENNRLLNVGVSANLGAQVQAQQPNPTPTQTQPVVVSPSPTPMAQNTPAPTPVTQTTAQTTIESQANTNLTVEIPTVSVKLGNTLGVSLGL